MNSVYARWKRILSLRLSNKIKIFRWSMRLQHTNQSKFDKTEAHGGYIVRNMFERLKGYEACTEM